MDVCDGNGSVCVCVCGMDRARFDLCPRLDVIQLQWCAGQYGREGEMERDEERGMKMDRVGGGGGCW